MEVEYLKNQIRAYKVALALIQAESEDDICLGCIGLDGAITKAKKGLRKLNLDLQDLAAPKEEKESLVGQIDQLSQQVESLPEAEDPTCMKTAGLCKIGPACFPLDGAIAMAEKAESERDEARLAVADGTGTCYCDTVGETPCAYCQIAELEATIERVKALDWYNAEGVCSGCGGWKDDHEDNCVVPELEAALKEPDSREVKR